MSQSARLRAAEVRGLLASGRLAEAERSLERALAEEPESAELLALACDLYRRRKRLDEARAFLARARRAGPFDAAVVSAAADLAFDLREFAEAASLYRELVDRRASRYHLSRLVLAKNHLGLHDEAAENARQGLETYPDDLWLLRGLASAEARRGHRDEAIRAYQRILALEPGDRFAYKELMRLKTEDAPAEEAASALTGLLRSGGRDRNPQLKTLAADRLRKAGRLEEAAEQYEAALDLEPANAYALGQLGFTYKKLGRLDRAAEVLSRAFLADPTSPYVRKSLESLLAQRGELERMVGLTEQALRLHPQVKSLHGIRKRIEKRLRGAGSGGG